MAGTSNIIPADSPSVFDALTSLQTTNPTAYQAIVRVNNPPAGIGGYLFDIPTGEEVHLKSSITRHFVESNTPVQDHIALEPEMITLRGLVAEVVATVPVQSSLSPTPNPLPDFPELKPPATLGQVEARDQADEDEAKKEAALSQQQSLYEYYQATVPGQTTWRPPVTIGQAEFQDNEAAAARANMNRQTQAFLYFQQLWWGRQICSVETPWGIWTNMALSDVRMSQGKDSKYLSDFVITFERIRVVGDIPVNVGNLAGRNALQQAPTTQQGTAGLVAPSTTQSLQLYNHFDP